MKSKDNMLNNAVVVTQDFDDLKNNFNLISYNQKRC